MKGRDIAPSSAETEKVRVTIRSKSPEFCVCLAELLFVNWEMGIEPEGCKSSGILVADKCRTRYVPFIG